MEDRGDRGRTNLMLLPIMISQFEAFFAHMFLHERVHDDLFANGVTRDFPGELAGPTALGIDVVFTKGENVLVVVFIHLCKS